MDDIIDLGDYLRRRDVPEPAPRTAFSVWGGEDERTRFALPLWRIVHLAGGARGGLVWVPAADERPSRLRAFGGAGLAVHLGEQEGRRWYLVVAETGENPVAIEGRVRDDLLFLAGECAGLLFFRGLAGEASDGED